MEKKDVIWEIKSEAKLPKCPYRQDLQLLCFEECGKGNAVDCEIWMRHSGLLAFGLSQAKD